MAVRVLLVSPNRCVEPYPVFPLGVGVLARSLRARGYETRVYDALAGERHGLSLSGTLREFRPDVVGVSIRNIDNTDSLHPRSYLGDAAGAIREIRASLAAGGAEGDAADGAPAIIAGGPAVSLLGEAALEAVGADYGVIGEGETALAELIETLAAGRTPATRLTRRPPSVERRTGVPPVGHEPNAFDECRRDACATFFGGADYDPLLAAFYLKEGGMLPVQTKRGCPHHCDYCTYPALEGSRFRARPAGEVVDDVERLRRDAGADYLFFADSVFNDHEGHYLEVAAELVKRGVAIRWGAFFRPAGIGRDEFALLKRAGLSAVEFGSDAASDATLAGLGKDFTMTDVAQVSAACAAEDIACAHFVIFGGPDETPATVEEGLANIARLPRAVVFAGVGVRVYPGAALRNRAIEDGLVSRDDDLLAPVFYISPRVDRAAMTKQIEASFGDRRDRIFGEAKDRERMAMLRMFGHRGPLWDILLRDPAKRVSKRAR